MAIMMLMAIILLMSQGESRQAGVRVKRGEMDEEEMRQVRTV